ncbi:restriction endonuclease subunit S [Streptomyces fradiae]|uniref:restriction endonuclease subunit S n=1 Tax=Streptomyces fradiae TaxID=1906 RepID=UPI0033CFADC4
MSVENGGPWALPEGWAWATFGDVAYVASNLVSPGDYPDLPHIAPNHIESETGRLLPYSTVAEDGVKSPKHHFSEGHILYSKIRPYLAKVVVPSFDGLCSADMYPVSTVLERNYLALWLRSPAFTAFAAKHQGRSVLPKINKEALVQLPVPVPPLVEQQRIVAVLEEQLSRLDAAAANLGAAVARTRPYLRSLLREMIPDVAPQHWESSTVGDAGTVELGRQRHPDWHNGPEMRPYLRVANVYEDRIDVSDLKEMDFSGVFEKFRLHSGDVLLNEGQSPELVGRPAIYRGEPPNVAFTNSLIRFRGRPGVLPEWALLVFRRHMHVGRFKREARITTNIAHLSAARLKGIEFPIPPVSEQEQLIKLASERFSALDRMIAALRKQQQQAAALRRSLLAEAFAGRLVPQDPADEPATILLERIRAEREAAGAAKPRRRAPRRAPAQRARTQGAAPATDAPPPPRADAPSLAAATQPTLDLEMPS